MSNVSSRIGFTVLAVGVLGIAVFAEVSEGQRPQRAKTVVVKSPARASMLSTTKLKATTPRRARMMTAAEVMEISKELKVNPSATQWENVTLDARHPYFPKAKLDLCGAAIHNASDNYVMMWAQNGLHAEAQVNFNASKAGDTYLVTYYLHTNMQNTLLKVFSSGNAPVATMNLGPGDHQIPVAVVPNFAGNQYVILLLWSDPEQSMYLQKVDVQLLNP